MGVKSTTNLSRIEAEQKYMHLRIQEKAFRRKILAEAVMMSDTELEDTLALLNDEANDGEGFENYAIVEI